MSEVKLVIDGKTLEYEGLFDAQEMYKLIDHFFWQRGFDKREIHNLEKVRESGKYVELELQPYKKISDYAKIIVRMFIRMFDVKEVEVELDGQKVRLNQGRILIIFDGFLETDYENRWENKPIYIFIRTVFDKFIYKSYTDKFEGMLEDEVGQLVTQLKSFLNLYRHKVPQDEKFWNP